MSLLPPTLTPHAGFKFKDATFFLVAQGVLFAVHHGILTRSKLFSNMFTLPLPPPGSDFEGEGTLEKPLEIPQLLAIELEVVLKFLYFDWPGPALTIIGSLRLLALSDRFGIPRARSYALHLLAQNRIPPILRVEYGLLCEVEGWVEQGFKELMTEPLHAITEDDARCASPELLLAIIRARSQVDMIRRQNFVEIPVVPHCIGCSGIFRDRCNAAWRTAWCAGLCRLYLNPGDYAPVATILEKLDAAIVTDMTLLCMEAVKDAIKRDRLLLRELDICDVELAKIRNLTRTPCLYTPALPALFVPIIPTIEDAMEDSN